MLEKIFELTPIAQNVIGGFGFWLLFELFRRSGIRISKIIGTFNRAWKEETLEFEQLQSQYMLAAPIDRVNFILLALYGAANRVVIGLIYMTMGAVANSIIEPIGLASYAIAMIYFFRALRAVPFAVRDGKSVEWHRERVSTLQAELDALRSGA